VDEFLIYMMVHHKESIATKQMLSAVDLLNLRNVSKIYIHKNRVISAFRFILFARKLRKENAGTQTAIVISDFRNTFFHYLRLIFPDSRVILVDDGFNTYVSYKKYIQYGVYLPGDQYGGLVGGLNKIIHFGFKYNYLNRKALEIFTVYGKELGLESSSYNDMRFIRELSIDRSLNYSSSLVYFSGTKLAERGVLTFDEEIFMMRKINKYWLRNGKKLVYVAKRSTSEKKISLLKNIPMPVIVLDVPMELVFIKYPTSVVPTVICSLGSTVNKTMPLIYNDMKSVLIEMVNMHKITGLSSTIYSKEFYETLSDSESVLLDA